MLSVEERVCAKMSYAWNENCFMRFIFMTNYTLNKIEQQYS